MYNLILVTMWKLKARQLSVEAAYAELIRHGMTQPIKSNLLWTFDVTFFSVPDVAAALSGRTPTNGNPDEYLIYVIRH